MTIEHIVRICVSTAFTLGLLMLCPSISFPADVRVDLLTPFKPARVENKDYTDKKLAGTFVELSAPNQRVSTTFSATSVTVRTKIGSQVPADSLFIIDLHKVECWLLGGTAIRGLTQ